MYNNNNLIHNRIMLKKITGTYNLISDTSWNTMQNQEIKLVCDTTLAPVVLNLPQISSILGGTLNVKIYVVDGAGNASANNITINPGGSNKIGASSSYVINVNNGGVYIQIGSLTNWLLTPNNTIGGGSGAGYSVFFADEEILQPTNDTYTRTITTPFRPKSFLVSAFGTNPDNTPGDSILSKSNGWSDGTNGFCVTNTGTAGGIGNNELLSGIRVSSPYGICAQMNRIVGGVTVGWNISIGNITDTSFDVTFTKVGAELVEGVCSFLAQG
jgi:hypothetical protein